MSERPKEYRRNVAAVIVDAAGRVLLGRKSDSSRFWHFPQGGVGHKETFEQALWRELREETGLTPEHLQIVARVGGLRYQYRKKNKKSKVWAGQQQTYFLLRCTGADVVADAGHSAEFAKLEWLPWRTLSPHMFVSFKRDVAQEVLAAFFPPDVRDLEAYWQQLNALSRYEFGPDGMLAAYAPEDRSLFLGTKEEARAAMEDLRRRVRAVQRQWESMAHPPRMLVVIHDAAPTPGKRSINCLRHAADLPDPLHVQVCSPFVSAALPQDALAPVTFPLPRASECLLTAHSPYRAVITDTALHDAIADNEQRLLEQQVCLLKLYLHISPEQFFKTCPTAPPAAYENHTSAAECFLRRTAQVVPWFIIPAEKKWYRDFVIATLMTTMAENATTEALSR